MSVNVPPSTHLPMTYAPEHDQRAAAQEWLCRAAEDRDVAAREWSQDGCALLRGGVLWDAVRAPFAAIDPNLTWDTDATELRRRMAELELFGPIVCDPYRPYFFFLVEPGTDAWWPTVLDVAKVECLGGTPPFKRVLFIPHIDRVKPSRLYWLMPPDGTGQLVDARHLYALLRKQVNAFPPGPSGEGGQ